MFTLLILLLALSLRPSPSLGWSTFDPREATISSIRHALLYQNTSCLSIVRSFLARIDAYDQQGPALDSFIAVSPNAEDYASALDALLAQPGYSPGPMFCVPIVLKDNYNTFDQPTTGGCLALQGAQPKTDAPVVSRLREAGAIILGKANMNEFALTGLSDSSLGGQVRNPYDLTRTPGGSSGGTGAAVAASLAVWGTGSDTVNSIRSPASANSLVGLRPTRGLITREGIMPLGYTQDAIGPLARTVQDVALALDVMVGPSKGDNVSALGAPFVGKNYENALVGGALPGLRIGVVEALIGNNTSNETTLVTSVFNTVLTKLEQAGAVLVPITDPSLAQPTVFNNYDVENWEFRQELDDYLQSGMFDYLPYDSFEQIFDIGLWLPGNEAVPPWVAAQDPATYNTLSPAYLAKLAAIEQFRIQLAMTFENNDVSVLFYPHQQILPVLIAPNASQSGRNGILAAVAGYPAIGVPGGFSPPTSTAPIGIPVGVEFMGRPFGERQLLNIAYSFEQMNRARRAPLSTWDTVPY
ncbi:amidase signature enzyme [Dacryopinax primogenitus]|uniref:Amidase signature enzyme n=1 Tax=Dacryopinax primogenitus (strain DJM 731) TaxID=1858805 RepID=M5G760_DACPD|nr:amidase signature enzyme [Dacryopinax primogenitus]EJU04559.1 amidase signature enzyme [Dacryopinax primogenitus]